METFTLRVSNPAGIFLVILPAVLLTFILTYVRMWNYENNFMMFVIEFFVLVIPMVFCLTVLTDTLFIQLIILAAFVVGLLLNNFWAHTSARAKQKIYANYRSQRRPQHTFITNVRATINLLTAIAILAIDFKKIFPVQYGKTKKYGFSLMDLGVGLFVYSSGITASNRNESASMIFKNTYVLFSLGLLRLFATSELNYHVSAWEYGLHWNFFFTLCVTKLISSLLIKLIGKRFLFIVGPLLLALHEALLQNGLADFVLSNRDRSESLFVANREGICSIMGYVALYLTSVALGDVFRERYIDPVVKTTSVLSVLTLILTIVLNYFFQTSRTLANSAYCSWTLFIGITMTLIFRYSEVAHIISTGSDYIPPILLNEAINYNGLFFFLICNVLTGLVNMIFVPRTAETVQSLSILAVYMFVSCATVVVLFLRKIKLKC